MSKIIIRCIYCNKEEHYSTYSSTFTDETWIGMCETCEQARFKTKSMLKESEGE